jgi:hypothetical protein
MKAMNHAPNANDPRLKNLRETQAENKNAALSFKIIFQLTKKQHHVPNIPESDGDWEEVFTFSWGRGRKFRLFRFRG